LRSWAAEKLSKDKDFVVAVAQLLSFSTSVVLIEVKNAHIRIYMQKMQCKV